MNAHDMRALVLSGQCGNAWEVGPRSAAELMEAATQYERAAALCSIPLAKAQFTGNAAWCRRAAASLKTLCRVCYALCLVLVPCAVAWVLSRLWP